MFEGMDKDDIPGYLIDYVSGWLKKHEINSIEEHYEAYQLDNYREHLDELADTVVEAALEMKK